jgi:uncharacterized peroxidase-related enzyme
MAWIDIVDEDDADGRLAEVYDAIAGAEIANILRVHSLAPDALYHHLKLYTAIMFDGDGLSRAEREFVATIVSMENDCRYCVEHHSTALRKYWSDARVDSLLDTNSAHETFELSDRESALAHHAARLTHDPSNIDESHLASLRAHDLNDVDLLNLTLVVAYFNFVNRIALGLGVDIDDPEGFEY